jgi:hypothetical protein
MAKPQVQKFGDWGKVGKLLDSGAKYMKDGVQKAMLEEAEYVRQKIVAGIRNQAPGDKGFTPPLKNTTLAVRKFRGLQGKKTLLVQQALLNSIKVIKKDGFVFVGVPDNARRTSGASLLMVAKVQEFGKRIKPNHTRKALAFLFAAFRKAGLEITAGKEDSVSIGVIIVPPRPFIGPAFDKWGEILGQRIINRVAKNLRDGKKG